MRGTAQQIDSEASSGPPEGVPAKGFLMLIDPDNGRGLAISLFETEDDRRQGDEVLNTMNPPGDGLGRRTAVEMYEVGVDVRL
jgi:hypothetical protein